jgi:hypothetical protein
MPDETMHTDELARIRDPNYLNIYSNWVSAGRTPWDVSLVFGVLREVRPNNFAIVEMATVALTPTLAKALIATLNATIREYEQENGEITIPGSLKKIAEERRKKASGSPSTSGSPSASPSPEPPEDEGVPVPAE